jgi:alkanesulfonate monooxygenase SsuD/methylene tetrahydromethanopterin reductase-like flavin-dependent oxidoreductase (luciferase family)
MEWGTLDVLSGGRTILGPCMGNPEKGVEREFEALGLPFKKRGYVLEEVLEVVRTLWTEGEVTFHGDYFDYDEVGFHSGT